MRVLSNKKGGTTELIYVPLFTLVFLALVTVFLFNYVGNWDDSTFLERTYLSKDMGLVVEVLQLVPGDVKVTYPKEIENMQVEINNEKVSVKNIMRGGFVDLTKYTPMFSSSINIINFIYPDTPKDSKFTIELSKVGNNIIPVATNIVSGRSTTVDLSQIQSSNSITNDLKKLNPLWEDEKIIIDYSFTKSRVPDDTGETDETIFKELCNQILLSNSKFLSRKECSNRLKTKVDTSSNALIEIVFKFDSTSSKTIIASSPEISGLANILKIQLGSENIEVAQSTTSGLFTSQMTITLGYKNNPSVLNTVSMIGNNLYPSLKKYYEP